MGSLCKAHSIVWPLYLPVYKNALCVIISSQVSVPSADSGLDDKSKNGGSTDSDRKENPEVEDQERAKNENLLYYEPDQRREHSVSNPSSDVSSETYLTTHCHDDYVGASDKQCVPITEITSQSSDDEDSCSHGDTDNIDSGGIEKNVQFETEEVEQDLEASSDIDMSQTYTGGDVSSEDDYLVTNKISS